MSTVTVRTRHNYQQEIIAGDHYLLADEPVSAGGEDSAPNPYELLLGALGACTSITLQMYARRKGWPLEGVEVVLEHRKDYVRDCDDCVEKTARIDVIDVHISLRGDLNADQQARLHNIAPRCPVSQTLSAGVKIVHHEA
jgi:putative redox protein